MDSAWIAYNKPKNPELANEYAGFLMALGLNGHLTKLATLNIHDNLSKVHMQYMKVTVWTTLWFKDCNGYQVTTAKRLLAAKCLLVWENLKFSTCTGARMHPETQTDLFYVVGDDGEKLFINKLIQYSTD